MSGYLKERIPVIGGADVVTGRAAYMHDIVLPDMLYAKVLRSPHAHARILSIDTSEAEALPGVHAVLTYQNVPDALFSSTCYCIITTDPKEVVLDQHILERHLRFCGDEVAAVAADSEEIAAQACRLIHVEYEVLPAETDPIRALGADAPEIHEDRFGGKNLACVPSSVQVGDFDKAWEECAVRYEGKFKLPIQKHMCMETSAAVASCDESGKLTVWCNTQAPHPVRTILSRALSLDEENVRVIVPDHIGGTFGQRAGLCGKADLLSALLSMRLHRPVKMVYDRWEESCATDSRHAGYIYLRLGALANGDFHALEVNSIVSAGAYISWGTTISTKFYSFGANVYRFPNTKHYGRTVYTNTMPAGAFRGFGNPQCMFAYEAAIDDLARQLGRDPVELRLQNIIRVGDPWQMAFPCKHTELAKCIRVAAEKIHWKEKRGAAQSGTFRRGVGLAIGRHTSTNDAANSVCIRLMPDGTLKLLAGLSESGNNAHTALVQVLAHSMETDIGSIDAVLGSTDSTPWDVGTHSTRGIYDRGNSIVNASRLLRGELCAFASKLWGVPKERVRYSGGAVHGEDGQTLALRQLAERAAQQGVCLEARASSDPCGSVPWHAHACEVEVDTETGVVKVLNYYAVHDVGVAINPSIVEGQIEGGVAQGLGYALREEMSYDAKGIPYNSGFHTYMLPTAEDLPPIHAIIVDAEDPLGPYGAKGVGECPVVPVAAAVASAVEDAIGVRLHELPMTPPRVLEALRSKKAFWPSGDEWDYPAP